MIFGISNVFPYVLALITATLCGAAIGIERTHRQKEAGIRTHIIVALGSALIMIVLERKSEIAILKSMGQTSGGIVLSFLISGFFAGLGGVAFGIPCGLLCSVFVNEIILAIEWVVNLFSYAKSFFTSSVPSSSPSTSIWPSPFWWLSEIWWILPQL